MPPVKQKSKLSKKIKDHRPKSKEPLWKGPKEDGISQSLLSQFLVCRERFRILTVEGLAPADDFNHRIEYGSMWHECEEALASQDLDIDNKTGIPWLGPLAKYCKSLVKKYPTAGPQIEHWYNVCKIQFPIYVSYWKRQPDVKSRTPLLQEETFNVPYRLPSGRVVRLRGKWDSVDIIGKGKSAGIYLQENKTKGEIHESLVQRQLTFDLQTGIYLVALQEIWNSTSNSSSDIPRDVPLRGVRYNVVRRPLSGGKGSIRKHKPSRTKPQGETDAEFYARLAGIIQKEPSHFFMRWKVELTERDLECFKRKFLDPILEQLCNWWIWVNTGDPWRCVDEEITGPNGIHWRHPFGVWNSLNEGRASDLDEYLATGSTAGLERRDSLFEELE